LDKTDEDCTHLLVKARKKLCGVIEVIDFSNKKFNQKIQPRTIMTRKETAEPAMNIFEKKRSKTPEKDWWDHRNSSDDGKIKKRKPMKRSEYQSAIEISSDSDDPKCQQK
jgi:hypothetical protein